MLKFVWLVNMTDNSPKPALCPAVTTTVSLFINFPTLLDRNKKQ